MPPPGYGYGGPYPGAAPRSSSGMRWFWILAAVGVLGVLVLVGGIAAYAAKQFSHEDLVVPSPTDIPIQSTSSDPMPTRTAPSTRTPSAGPSPSASAPPGETVTISGINENKTVACNGNVVNISGISNTVTLTGHCSTVNVSGLQNVVTVDNVDTIEASGLNNNVTYHSGSPQISKNGSGNVVEQG